MEKNTALQLVVKETKQNLNNRNTIFANVGAHKESWWLEPSNDKLQTGFYFILNDEKRSRLLLFKIPPDTLKQSSFRQRDDKGASQIIIPLSGFKYVDKKGFDFTQFLISQVEY
jgi:hypothetical protein